MKFTSAFVLLASALGAQATCFNSGETWGNKQVALDVLRTQCNTFFAGTYGPSGAVNGYRGKCVNANGKKLEFQLWHVQGGDRYISLDECYDGFQKEINGCDHGGNTKYTNWQYKADPNAGSC